MASNCTPLTDVTDRYLAFWNAVRLGADYGLSKLSPQATTAVRVASWVISFAQLIANYRAIPWDKTTKAEKAALLFPPLFSVCQPFIGNYPKLALASSSIALWGTLRNAAPKLWNSLKEATSRPREAIPAALLHIFNIGAQGLSVHHALKEVGGSVPEQKPEEKPFPKMDQEAKEAMQELYAKCATENPAWKQILPAERVLKEEISPHCPNHAARVFGITVSQACEQASETVRNLELDPVSDSNQCSFLRWVTAKEQQTAACKLTCAEFNQARKDLTGAILLHFRQIKDDPKPALHRAEEFVKTFKWHYGCK